MAKTISKKKTKDDNLLALKALETLYAAQNLNKRQLYFQNFIRGIFFSVGSLVGITLVATIVLWILSVFDSYPFIQHISDSIKSSL